MSATQIFISYARDDDALPDDLRDAKGFVTHLLDQLRYEFQMFGSEPRPKIWRDVREVERGDQFDSKIEDAIAASSILLVVLSKNWMARPYCRRELKSFAERWGAEGEMGVRQRIVVAGKRHIAPDERPSLLQGQEGFAFYSLEDSGGAGLEHEFFARGSVRDPSHYYDQVEKLAAYLWRAAERIATGGHEPGRQPVTTIPSVPVNGRTIYLAKPATDMFGAYDRLVKELGGRGYTVVPEAGSPIPEDSSAVDFIDQALRSAEASVHLLGEKSGPSPEDQPPIVKLQLARSAAMVTAGSCGRNTGFHRIIWAPKILDPSPSLASASSPERDPLAVLTKFDHQLPADKIEGDSLSKFVDFLMQHLVRTAPVSEKPHEIKSDSRVYLYHSQEDTDYAFALADALQERQIETILPVFEGPPAEVKSLHRKYLAECDAVALCWATSSEVWVRAQSSDLRDWHGLGRKQQFAYRGVIAGPPPGSRKRSIKHLFPRGEIDIIVDLADKDGPAPELLDPLVPAARPIAP